MKKFYIFFLVFFLFSFIFCSDVFASNAVSEQSCVSYAGYNTYNSTGINGQFTQAIVQHQNNITGACFQETNNKTTLTSNYLLSLYDSNTVNLLATSSCVDNVNGDYSCCYFSSPIRNVKDHGYLLQWNWLSGTGSLQPTITNIIASSNWCYKFGQYSKSSSIVSNGLQFKTYYENTMPDISTTTTNYYSTTTNNYVTSAATSSQVCFASNPMGDTIATTTITYASGTAVSAVTQSKSVYFPFYYFVFKLLFAVFIVFLFVKRKR